MSSIMKKLLIAPLYCIPLLSGCTATSEQNIVQGEVYQGFFKANVERLAIEYNLTPVLWEADLLGCDWIQQTNYAINAETPTGMLAQYASTQDFKITVSTKDGHTQMVYVGPRDRLLICNQNT